MKFSFNDRTNSTRGVGYYAGDFDRGPAQSAGLSLPVWCEDPTQQLSLSTPATLRELDALIGNRHPETGQRLTARMNTRRVQGEADVANRRADYELSAGAPKSASIMMLVADDKRIARAFEKSIRWTMQFAARYAATRVRRNGRNHDRQTGHTVALLLFGVESRERDPHLHSHSAYMNATWDSVEGRWKAVQFGPILDRIRLLELWASARFQRELAGLGYDLEWKDGRCEIAGVSAGLIERFSKRAQKINREVAKWESARSEKLGPGENKRIGLRLRCGKAGEAWNEMHSRWQAEAGSELEQLKNLRSRAEGRAGSGVDRGDPLQEVTESIIRTIQTSVTKTIAVSTERVLLECLRTANGRWSGGHFITALTAIVKAGKVGTYGKGRLTTRPTLKRMHSLVSLINRTKDTCCPWLGEYVSAPKGYSALPVAMASRDPVVLIGADASPRCRRMMATILHENGKDMVYAIPTAIACLEGFSLVKVLDELGAHSVSQDGRRLLVGQAENLSLSELERVVSLATSGRLRVMLSASRNALCDPDDNRPLTVLNRTSWLREIPFAQPPSTKRDTPRLQTRSYGTMLQGLVKAKALHLLANAPASLARIADIASALLDAHGEREVPVLADDPALVGELNEAIYRVRAPSAPIDGNAVAVYQPITRGKHPSMGDLLVSCQSTRHFERGEVLRVTATNADCVTIRRPGGELKTVSRKVWNRLQPVSSAILDLRPGALLRLGEPYSPLKLRLDDTVRVLEVASSGEIKVDGGRLPHWYRFFSLGYCRLLGAKLPKKPKAAVAILRGRPDAAMRKAIRQLAADTRGNVQVVALSPQALPEHIVERLGSRGRFTVNDIMARMLAEPTLGEWPAPAWNPEPDPVLDVAVKMPSTTLRIRPKTYNQPTIEIQ